MAAGVRLGYPPVTFKYLIGLACGAALAAAAIVAPARADDFAVTDPGPKTFAAFSKESGECAACHAKENPGITQQWGQSRHFANRVGCYECHKAEPSSPTAFEHRGVTISSLVSPKVCSQCHKREVSEFDASHHATAGLIIGSLDNTLAEVVEGAVQPGMSVSGESAVAVQGCWQCHGSPVKVLPGGKLDPASWPNSGIGRLNPDGSKGSCNACHQRHSFSLAQARAPETCGKCHLGPDHPQKEIYEESKHGIAYRANEAQMNLSSPKWIPGQDYTAAPTCATCHMSATATQPVSHDVGGRISWTLRPPISEKIDEAAKRANRVVKPWEDRRADMKKVCVSCHQDSWVENWYKQFDGTVITYNEKFAKPGAAIMKVLLDTGLRTKIDFDEKIEWAWYKLWHHEGRRARHGAAMQAPDYVQWHGFFEIAERFYTEVVPEARAIAAEAAKSGKTAEAAQVTKVIDEIMARPEHQWAVGKIPPGRADHEKKREEFMRDFNSKK